MITNGSLAGAYSTSVVASRVVVAGGRTTTTMPLSQSASTALSSGSLRKLDGVDPVSEKFATLMLSVLACW